MAKYGYSELKYAAQTRDKIGSWCGVNVYSTSKYKYDRNSDYFYVLYDDGNKLVRWGQVYGTINDRGGITECPKTVWVSPQERFAPKGESKKEASAANEVRKVVPATTTVAESVKSADDFFARIDREINELLADVNSKDFDIGDIKI